MLFVTTLDGIRLTVEDLAESGRRITIEHPSEPSRTIDLDGRFAREVALALLPHPEEDFIVSMLPPGNAA